MPVELPLANAHPGVAMTGMAVIRGQRTALGLVPDDRRRHLPTVSKTGIRLGPLSGESPASV